MFAKFFSNGIYLASFKKSFLISLLKLFTDKLERMLVIVAAYHICTLLADIDYPLSPPQ